MLDVLRRPDISTYYAVQVQGLPDLWVQVGENRNLFGATGTKAVITPQSVVLSYPRLEPLKGLGTPGSLSLELSEVGAYFSTVLGTGAVTYLTADLSSTATTIHVESTNGFPTSGTLTIHSETISYTGKTENTFTGCTRAVNDLWDIAREHGTVALLGANVDAIKQPKVRVTQYPRSLLGRWVSVRCAALDPAGYPIQDDQGNSSWEVWRGVITGFPRAPDGLSYSLKAETLERLISDKMPDCGVSGRLDIRNATKSRIIPNGSDNHFEIYENQEFFFQAGRNAIVIGLCIGDGGEGLEQTINVPVLDTFDSPGWLTLNQVETEIKNALDFATSTDWEVRLLNRVEDGVLELQLWAYGWAWYGGDISVSLLPSESSIWGQLGFLGEHKRTHFCNTGQDKLFWYQANVAPASVDIREGDGAIPIILTGLTRGADGGGWVKVGEEAIGYTGITWHTGESPNAGWDTRAVLTGCQRGVGGTSAGSYRFPKDEDTDPPEVTPTYALDGEPNVWKALAKVLCGTGGTATNLFTADGATWGYYTEPGLGISAKHFDGQALYNLAGSMGLLHPLTGCPDSLRSWLSDALALEGFGLVTCPGADGYCLLRPVRLGGANPGEECLAPILDSTGGITVTDGLSAIKNQVTFEDFAGNKAVYNNVDSQETYRVIQGVNFSAPTASLGTFPTLVPTSLRLFNLLGEGYAELDATLAPTGTRFLAPGDVCLIEFPNATYTGLWRILSASTPLRGKGTVKVRAVKVDYQPAYLYAPTSEVASIDGDEITITTGDGVWFREGAGVRIYDPTNYLGGETATVATVTGDVLTVTDLSGSVSEGWKVEFETYSTSNSEERYLWLDTARTWGD